MVLKEIIFDSFFDVKNDNDNFVFYILKKEKFNEFIDDLFNYFFDEKNIFNHFNYLHKCDYNPDIINYKDFYIELKKFIDNSDRFIRECDETDEVLLETLIDEGIVIKSESGLQYQYDKAGKIGEYFFSVILERFFKMDCLIPKASLTTDYDMSVYGIDVLYYRDSDSTLFLGESKFTKNLGNGITQVNASLKIYEKQMRDEYQLVLNSWGSQARVPKFHEIYGEVASKTIKFDDFLVKAEIKQIGVPIFIMHGLESEFDEIIKKLNKVKKEKFFNINIVYYVISLPVFDKEVFFKCITEKIENRMNEYERKSTI